MINLGRMQSHQKNFIYREFIKAVKFNVLFQTFESLISKRLNSFTNQLLEKFKEYSYF